MTNAKRKATTDRPSTATPPTVCVPPLLHGRWLAFLIARGDTNEAVRLALTSDDLPCPSDAELDAIRVACALPPRFKPSSTSHAPSLACVRRLGVEPFVRETPEAEQALMLLRTPRARELVEAGVVVAVPVASIVQVLATYLKVIATVPAVELYAKSFFDVDAVSRAQLGVLVAARVRQAVERTVGGVEDKAAARRAIAADARTTAAALPSSALAWRSVLMAAGWSPGRVELAEVVDQMGEIAALRGAQALLRGGRDDGRRAESFVGVLQRLRQVREGLVNPNRDLTEKYLGLRLKQAGHKVTTLTDLVAQGGEIGTRMMPGQPRDDEPELDDATPGGSRTHDG